MINAVVLIDLAALALYLAYNLGWVFLAAWAATLYVSYSFFDIPNSNLVSFYVAFFYLLFFLPTAYFSLKNKSGALILLTTTFALILWMTLFVPYQWDYPVFSAAALLSLYFCYLCVKNWERNPNYWTGSIFVFNAMTFFLMVVNSTIWPDIISYLITITCGIAVARFAFKAPLAATGLAFFFLIPLGLYYDKYAHGIDKATLYIAPAALFASAAILYAPRAGRFQRAMAISLFLIGCVLFNL